MARRKWILIAAMAAGIAAPLVRAQEDMPPAGRGGGQGGRGGRGGRAGITREFLGLGPAPDEAAAKKGEPLYKQYCATCHGPNARGAQGPNLVRSVVVLHDEKGEEIGPIIKSGKRQAGMPGFPGLSQDDLNNIAQYLHLQVELRPIEARTAPRTAACEIRRAETRAKARRSLTGHARAAIPSPAI